MSRPSADGTKANDLSLAARATVGQPL